MNIFGNENYFEALDALVRNSKIIIDRKKGSSHPKYPNTVYKVDYGYINNTTAIDGNEVGVYKGTSLVQKATGVLCTFELIKKDTEVKILIGLTNKEMNLVYKTHNTSEYINALLVKR